MNFDQRKKTAQSIIIEFLDVFTPPRGLDDSQLASRISQLADAFARRMPIKGEYTDAVHRVLTKIMDTHQSNTWPPQAAFVMAMPNQELRQFSAQETFKVKDPVQLTTARMEAGEAVDENSLWGQMARELPRGHLDRYRNASALGWMEVYGKDAPRLMHSKYGSVVDSYFPEAKGRAT